MSNHANVKNFMICLKGLFSGWLWKKKWCVCIKRTSLGE